MSVIVKDERRQINHTFTQLPVGEFFLNLSSQLCIKSSEQTVIIIHNKETHYYYADTIITPVNVTITITD